MKSILITGAAGHVGKTLLSHPDINNHRITACDVNPIANLNAGAQFRKMDVRDRKVIEKIFSECKPDCVIHLASVVTPPKGTGREFAYDVDVQGSRNIIDASLAYGVKRLVVTSSGAAYGYHPENIRPLKENDPIRGNYEFPYSHHKRLVEEMLAAAREDNPELEQVILRVGTILGEGLENQITALFHKPRLLALQNNESPFVFIWDQDLAKILIQAADKGKPGIYNVAGDGALGVTEIAAILGKPILRIPAWALKLALSIASPLGLSRYGPEQVRFLQYRPVLDNTSLKADFGYEPELTSIAAFKAWQKQAGL